MQSRDGRSLRQRNPIQAHPCVIAGEKPRQLFHARRVKAPRFAQEEPQAQDRNDVPNQDFVEAPVIAICEYGWLGELSKKNLSRNGQQHPTHSKL